MTTKVSMDPRLQGTRRIQWEKMADAQMISKPSTVQVREDALASHIMVGLICAEV